MQKNISQRSLTRYMLRGDWETHPFEYWAAAFGTAKAHQLVSSGVLVEDIDDSESEWTGDTVAYEIDLDAATWEVTK